MQREYVIDGTRFSTLEGFYAEIGRGLIPDVGWGENLNAFNDILRGGFGTPPEGFTLRWRNSDISRRNLGSAETVRQLRELQKQCHPDSRAHIQLELNLAMEHVGPTVFDWLVEIIAGHGIGGEEAESCVVLILE